VIVPQNGFSRRAASSNVDMLLVVIKEGGTGTLRFGYARASSNTRGWGVWNQIGLTDTPAFVDVADLDNVYRIVSDLRDATKS
jgi:hypothetical protein